MFFISFIFSLVTGKQSKSKIETKRLWTMNYIKNVQNLANEMKGKPLYCRNTMSTKPPFYEGVMPLEFTAIGKRTKENEDEKNNFLNVFFVHDFGDWSNHFIYQDVTSMFLGIPDGIIATKGKRGYVVGECKIKNRIIKDGEIVRLEVVENHFNMRGKVIFTSTSEFDLSTGFKIKEIETEGQKEGDYFPLWPNGGGTF